jgi:hypothetical protein
LNSYGIKIEKIGMFEIKFIAENDIIVPEEEIAITCIVYDSKSSVDIQVTDATPIVRLSIKGENSILADIGDTVTIDAEIVSKEMMSSV